MKRNASIEQMFDDMDHAIIKKYITFPMKSTLLIILSIGFIELDTHLPQSLRNNLTPLIAILTLTFMFWGFLIGMVDKTYYKYMITGNRINFREIYFDRRDYNKLIGILETHNFSNLSLLQKSIGHGMKLKIAYTDDKSLCYVQVLQYVPFQYARKSEALQLDSYEVDKLLAMVS